MPSAGARHRPSTPGDQSWRPAAGTWRTPGRASSPGRTSWRTDPTAPHRSALSQPTGYGLLDIIGNVWEWTTDWYRARHPDEAAKACCVPRNPRGGGEEESFDPAQPRVRIP